jgi:CheY-like chemotaxis protein
VISASSGPEALEILLTGSSPIDMVLCDLGMPLVNGWQIAQHVKSLKIPPTFYLVTGWGAEIPVGDPRRRLVNGVIAKPIDPKVLDELLAAKNTKIESGESILSKGHARDSRPNER